MLKEKPGNFPAHLETFKAIYLFTPHAIWELSRLSGNFPGKLKLFRQSGNCSGHLKTYRAIWKLFRLYGNFPCHLEIFQAIWELSRQSINIPGHQETFQVIWKLSRPSFPIVLLGPLLKLSEKFPEYLGNFPGSHFGPSPMLL